jgi:hypothetical protein
VDSGDIVTDRVDGSLKFGGYKEFARTAISGASTATGSQDIGLAGRITVNSAVLAAPSTLVAYQSAPPTPVGDAL